MQLKVGVGPESESDNRNCQESESESDDGASDSKALVKTYYQELVEFFPN